MVIRIASAVLTLAALLALISGFLFWTGTALNSIQLHMLLGFLAVGALLVIAAAQVFARGGSWSLAAAAVVLGAATIALGITQTSLMIGNLHWIVEIVHLLLGLLIVGLGHMLAARYRRNNAD
jgi:endonuclease/exonuclease/phosphatase (EEP) superfamily protein YafD